MPALILVTLLLALWIFLAWWSSPRGQRPSPSWLGDISIDMTSSSESTSDHHHCDTVDTADDSVVTEFHVEAEDSCSGDDGGWDSGDDGCSSDD